MHVVAGDHAPIKIWTPEGDVEPQALAQLKRTASLPCIFKHIAVMPDVHWGIGATVGSVVATEGAIIPAAVGVDIGCGMMAVKLPFTASDLPDSLTRLRSDIERVVPVGKAMHDEPLLDALHWGSVDGLHDLPFNDVSMALRQLGTLGGGNHFIEVCLDTEQAVWIVLHSGSRGIGNKIGRYYIDRAKSLMAQWFIRLEDPDLAYLAEGSDDWIGYMRDLEWAQSYAMKNRELMMSLVFGRVVNAILGGLSQTVFSEMTINCHHNYAAREHHFGRNVIVTRKGAVRAQTGDFGIIPGSMGARTFIVRGKGHADSFCSCSHGAGRRLSRSDAAKQYTVDDLAAQTAGIECRKDAGVLDEIPSAYKPIDQVMANQSDLVEVVAELHQVLCVKG